MSMAVFEATHRVGGGRGGLQAIVGGGGNGGCVDVDDCNDGDTSTLQTTLGIERTTISGGETNSGGGCGGDAPHSGISGTHDFQMISRQFQQGLEQSESEPALAVAGADLSMRVMAMKHEMRLHEDSKRHNQALMLSQQAHAEALHRDAEANTKAAFESKMATKREELEHKMQTARIRERAKRAKVFDELKANVCEQTRHMLSLQLKITVGAILLVAVAHVWNKLTAVEEACIDPTADIQPAGVWRAIAWLPGAVSQPMLNAR